jgi:hypothetical protein
LSISPDTDIPLDAREISGLDDLVGNLASAGRKNLRNLAAA